MNASSESGLCATVIRIHLLYCNDYLRRGLPCCVSTTLWPAIVNVADRFAQLSRLTVSVTVPGPLPDAPDETTAHDAGLEAVHAQPGAVDTVTDSVVAV